MTNPLTKEQRRRRSQQQKERRRLQQASETPEQRQARLNKRNEKCRARRANLSDEELQKLRKKQAEKCKQLRQKKKNDVETIVTPSNSAAGGQPFTLPAPGQPTFPPGPTPTTTVQQDMSSASPALTFEQQLALKLADLAIKEAENEGLRLQYLLARDKSAAGGAVENTVDEKTVHHVEYY